MSLRNRLLALSLLTLLLPWSGWTLLQELEGFLRETQENALLSTARTLAGNLPFASQSRLLYSPHRYVVMRNLERSPVLDGFAEDWPNPQQGFELSTENASHEVLLLAGSDSAGLFLFFDVRDTGGGLTGQGGRNGIELLLRSPRGLLRFDIHPEAPGPLQLFSDSGGGQAEGFWLDTEYGFQLELAVPAFALNSNLAFTLKSTVSVPADGTGPSDLTGQNWLDLVTQGSDLSARLADSVPGETRVWLVNLDAWVLADSGQASEQTEQKTTWAQRLLYRLVAGRRTEIEPLATQNQSRLQSGTVISALAGQEARSWFQDLETAAVYNTVAVPVELDGQTRGAVVLQTASDGLLLVTNRALGRLLITTLVISFGLAGGLWFFATRLSQRVRRLSSAVSESMDGGVAVESLPLTSDRDELGELARNNQKLLIAVADYNRYLQTLAGKLSHELKTPLAITRSSLDNLSSQSLDGEARQFLQRAQEGVERQAAIVRAMSEANRLEAAIRVAEWEDTDLADLLAKCAEGYRAVHSGRRIETRISDEPACLRCAPELLAQALDKLVDNAITLSSEADTVTISLDHTDDGFLLSVSNSGTCLPEEFQDRIFDSLVSVRDKKGNTPHLGLGLYIVRLVAKAHDGWVKASNIPDGQGVEFGMYLPAGRSMR